MIIDTLLRDKDAINAVLAEIGGKSVAEGNITATAKAQKQIIANFLSGADREQNKEWQPRYMRFPMEAYTKRGDVEAIKQWKAIEPAFVPA